MSNLQQYTKATVYLNGSQLTEETKVSIKRATGAQQVKTVAKGLAGPSPGAPMITVSVSNAVPAAAFEYNPGPAMGALAIVELTVFVAGKTLTSKGWFDSDNFSHGVETPSNIDFEFIGQFADWE